MKYDIFISYRREGGYDTAKHLYDLLVRDNYKVSFDIDTLRNGDFDTQLLKRVEQCKDFILIVDKHTFDRTLDPNFNPKNDWVQNELAHALKHKKNIVPVFLSGVTSFPKNLPPSITDVTKRNGPQYSQYYFDDFYNKLKKDFLKSKGYKNSTIVKGAIVVALTALSLFAIHTSIKYFSLTELQEHSTVQKELEEFNTHASNTLKSKVTSYNYSDSAKILKLWKDKALGGDASSQYNLGLCYYTGYHIEKNAHKAAEWFTRAAKQNMQEAKDALDFCSRHDIKVENDFTEELYVDLGLTSGTLWATHNLGANKVHETGYYLAWGEIEEKLVYNYDTYPNFYYLMFKTPKRSSICGTKYDAATALLGSNWSLPTYKQALELYEECIWTYTKDYNSTGTCGSICTGPNGNHIFFPAGGLIIEDSKAYIGCGNYWTGSLENFNDIDWANFIDFTPAGLQLQTPSRDHRFLGRNIKAVFREPDNPKPQSGH